MSRLIAGRATLWSMVDIGGRQAVQFAVTMILARLIAPADFGAIAIMLFFAAFGTTVIHSAVSTALVQQPASDQRQQSVMFWWVVAVSALLGLALVAAGPALARFYRLPLLGPLMVVAAAQLMAMALGVVPGALMTRALRFADLAVAGLAANLVSGAVGIALALRGYGAWALAAQLVLAALVQSIVIWWRSGWRPGFDLDPRAALPLVKFAGWLAPSNLLELLYSQGFSLIVGRIYGARPLGLFNRAANLQQIPQNIAMQIVGRVSLPMFSARRDDPAAMARGLLGANRLVMIFYAPLMLGIAACPRLLIDVLFGRQWLSVAPYLTILALAALPYPVQMLNLQLLLATGRADRYLRVELTRKAVAVGLVVAGSLVSLAALAWSMAAAALAGLAISCAASRRVHGVGGFAQLADLGSILVAAAAMAAAVAGLQRLLPWPPLASLATIALAGAAFYFLLCRLLRVVALDEAIELASQLRAERSPA